MLEIIDTLEQSSVTENLTSQERDNVAKLFALKSYRTGEMIAMPENIASDNFSILAQGNIKVKIPYGVGESTVCTLVPGDLTDLNGIAAGTGLDAKLYADGDAAVFSMNKKTFDNLVQTEPTMMCGLIRGMMHNLQSIVRRLNSQVADLKNYIYGTHTL
jgi:signal-transduction protein with cAMP-binding, CBS, and nucleotidyltransferase domain